MVLDFLLVKGDRVVMKMDPEARSWRGGSVVAGPNITTQCFIMPTDKK